MDRRCIRRTRLRCQGQENIVNNLQFSSSSVKTEEEEEEEEGGALPDDYLAAKEVHFPPKEAIPRSLRKRRETPDTKLKIKKSNNIPGRWSADRYNRALQRLLEILRAEGAVFGKPISRSQFREVARRDIGDTGLLDQLLKNIVGKVAPGGTERFKRWYNPNGVVEYWLESADLDRIREEAGVQDPFWVPPSGCKPSGNAAAKDLSSSSDVIVMKEEVSNLKRELKELVSKKKDQGQINNLVEAMDKDYADLQAKVNRMNKCDIERSCSLRGLQEKYQLFTAWQEFVENHLKELTNSLSNIQGTKDTHPGGPAYYERSEDWLKSNQTNEQEDELENWLIVTDPSNVKEEEVELYPAPAQNVDFSSELAMLKHEVSTIKRDMKKLLHRQQDGISLDCNQAGSLNVNPQLEYENPLLLSQRWKEMAEWRTKMDQQLEEIRKAVSSLQATNLPTPFDPSLAFY